MTYDFETPFVRPGPGWIKWDDARAAGCPPDIMPFTVADMEYRAAPEIIRAVEAVANEGYWGYTYEEEDFRGAVTDWFARRHGWHPRPEWLVGTAGVVPALYAAVRTFTRPGDGVLIQPPVYPPFYSAVKAGGRAVVENPLVNEDGHYRMDFDDLRKKAKGAGMMILCSPHNPVGRVWSEAELRRVADICLENDLVLFSDEIHCDIIPGGGPFVSVGRLDSPVLAKCLIGTSASKSFSLAGLACSSIFVADEGLRAKFEQQQEIDGYAFNATFGVAATKAAYREGEAWLDAMLDQVRANAAWLEEFAAARLPGARLSPLQGTYLAWLDLNGWEMEEADLTAFLQKEARFYANPGGIFGPGGAGFVRINLACPKASLCQAMERVQTAASARGLA